MRSLFIGVVLSISACAAPPIEWRQAVPVPEPAGGSALAIASDLAPAVQPGLEVSLGEVDGCASTARTARAEARGPAYAAWWRVRPDSSAELLVARSDDGGATWSAPSVAESRDRSTLGCARPAAGVAADPVTGTVHVAYWATLPDGPGLFFSHATDATGLGAPALPPEHLAHVQHADSTAAAPSVLWHAPVAVVHGERPSRAAVAVRGDTVAVAFEDPNSGPRRRIALAWSRQTGHIFDLRDHAVSAADVAASEPMVALRGDAVAVAWREEDGWRARVGRVGAGKNEKPQ